VYAPEIGDIISPVPQKKCKKMTATATKTSKPAPPSVTDDPRWARIVARDKTAEGHLGCKYRRLLSAVVPLAHRQPQERSAP
jgi:hypothetical protein